MGIDKNGEKSIKVHNQSYEEQVSNTLVETHDAAIRAFEAMPAETLDDHWELDYIMIGLGIEGQVGVANIINLRAFPRFRLFFTRPAD